MVNSGEILGKGTILFQVPRSVVKFYDGEELKHIGSMGLVRFLKYFLHLVFFDFSPR